MDTPKPPRTSALASPLVLTLAALGVLALGGVGFMVMQSQSEVGSYTTAALDQGGVTPTAVPQCTGAVPENATLCPGDDLRLSASTPRTLVAACSSPTGSAPKCQYTCSTGWMNAAGTACVRASNLTVTPADSSAAPGSSVTLTASALNAARYDWRTQEVGAAEACPTTIATTPVTTAVGEQSFTAPLTPERKLCVVVWASSKPLKAGGCAENSCWTGPVVATVTASPGISSIPLYSCTGTLPEGAKLCPGDDAGLAEDTALTPATTCSIPDGSAPKCQFTCVSGWPNAEGTACVRASELTVTPATSSAAPGSSVTLTASAMNAQRYDWRSGVVPASSACPREMTGDPVTTATGEQTFTAPASVKQQLCVVVWASSKPSSAGGCAADSCWAGPVVASISASAVSVSEIEPVP